MLAQKEKFSISNVKKMLIYVFMLFIVIVSILNHYCIKRRDILVVLYDTNLNDKNVQKYIKTLNYFGYRYKIIGDEKWKGFGKKIKSLEYFLNTLPQGQVVVISDARDVFVSRKSEDLLRNYKKLANGKVLVSTELGCCEDARQNRPPGSIRLLNGEVNRLPVSDPSATEKWVQAYTKLASETHGDKKWKWVNPNAGLYMGRVGDILKMYRMMNIVEENEDDQSVLSEIILQNPEMFVLDHLSDIFSSSFKWDPSSEEIYGGCYYAKNEKGLIKNLIFGTHPYFLHFPGKHFDCYDKIYEMLPF